VPWRKDYDLSSLFSTLKEMRNIQEVALKILQSEVNDREANELGKQKNLTYSPQYIDWRR